MADDDENNDNGGASQGGFGFIQLPGSIGQLLEHHASLNVEQLLMLRKILNADRESVPNNYFDGMIVTLLRVVHHVDSDGRTVAEVLAAKDARKER